MLPGDKEHPFNGKGILYRIHPSNGTESPWWKTEGWYARRVFISENGEYLARLNDWPAGAEPADDDLGIAFYNIGKLIKKYSTKDLVKDSSAVDRSLWHYEYIREIKGFSGNYTFSIVSIDNIEYQFNVPSGDIISRRKI